MRTLPMYTKEQNLIRLAIGRDEAARESIRDIDAAKQWPELAATAARWNVGSFLLARLDKLGAVIAPEAREILTRHHRIAFGRSALVASRGAELCRRLEERGIPAVIFKGLAAIGHLHAGPQERTIKDADILVLEQDVTRAAGELARLGLVAEDGGDLSRYRALIRRLPGFAGNEGLAFRSAANGEEVDLHWRFGRNPVKELRPERILARAEWKEILGTVVRVVSPMDGLVLSAHHAVRENFAPDAMLRDLLDTKRWFALLAERGESESALRHVEHCRLSAPVHAMAALLGEQQVMTRLAGSAGSASGDLVHLFRLQLRDGPVSRDLATLADPSAWRKILTGMLAGWGGYRALMAEFETKALGKRLPVWGRLFAVIGRLGGLGAARWKSLRTIAKVKAGYQDLPG